MTHERIDLERTAGGRIPEDLGAEIDIFETEIGLRKEDKFDEVIFAETRLRRGVYGQRYDNGQRFDGQKTQQLKYPEPPTKGPNTVWHAPGMVRIKIPFGGLNTEQMDLLAELGEEYSDEIIHITTRQDVQLHYVHIDDTVDLMRRLAAVGITTREACGNSVRNVTACPLSGVCHTEAFDVTPYANAFAHYFLGHPDVQDFGRKFKSAFSGCKQEACGLTNMHDLGAIAVTRMIDGEEKRGFELYVGGGLGAVPHEAKLFAEFVPEEELLPVSQAIARVFARLGEKANRARARIKFLVAKLGIDEFRRLVTEERKTMPEDPRWTAYLDDLHAFDEEALKPGQALNGSDAAEGFSAWRDTNVYPQRQSGYAVAAVTLPLGDITSSQLRALSDICRKYVKDTVRTTVEQNVVLRWVSESDLPALYSELSELGLGLPGASTIFDVTACPGTDTCKLGISSSRGLAGELRTRLAESAHTLDESVKSLRVKISGCFNSCGQHHAADIGFYGVSRKINGITVPTSRLSSAANGKRTPALSASLWAPCPRRTFLWSSPASLRALSPNGRAATRAFTSSSTAPESEPSKRCSTISQPSRRTKRTHPSITIGATRANTPLATWARVSAPARWFLSRSSSSVPASEKPSRLRSCSTKANLKRPILPHTGRCFTPPRR